MCIRDRYVYRIEEAVIKTLLHFGVTGHRVAGAPGIYVRLDDPTGHAPLAQRPMKDAGPASPDFTGLGKIAALGIKVSRRHTLSEWMDCRIAAEASSWADTVRGRRRNSIGFANLSPTSPPIGAPQANLSILAAKFRRNAPFQSRNLSVVP